MFPNNPTKYQYLLALTMLLVSTPILACGWWGDGEQSSENSSIVRLPDYPKLNSQQLADADHLASLGNQYRSTVDAHHSYSRAVHFFELAAEKGNVHAQHHLGELFISGNGDQSAGILLSDSRHTLTVAESSQLENLLIDLKQAWLVSNE
jgi:TPR repeat protein